MKTASTSPRSARFFEHTGGRLYWFGEAKTVKAVNTSREIELKIGDANATVNNQTLTLERAPYLDSGRMLIVPLTFIRDALNLKIQLIRNPAGGRLRANKTARSPFSPSPVFGRGGRG